MGALAAVAVAGGGAASAHTGAAVADPDAAGVKLSASDRHLLRRFSYGLNGNLLKQVREAGSARAWFNQQLHPNAVHDEPGDAVADWFPLLSLTPQQNWQRYQRSHQTSSTQCSEFLVGSTLCRRIVSKRQVLEVMAEFWSNHLHVSSPNDKSWPQRAAYDQVIRANALGSFEDLLKAAVLHPAMLLYLDNYESTKDAPNENLGRELLECHTVGVDAGYSETDVESSTRILTGLAVDRGGSWEAYYNFPGHYRGRVHVMDFSAANAQADGRQVVDDYLSYLAYHPSTAQRLALKLATRFVADEPPSDLVDDVANAYLAADTDITQTLLALVNHPEFTSGSQPKVRTPSEDFVATVRALRVKVETPHSESALANQVIGLTTSMGQRPFDWPTPDGFPDQGQAWASATRMLGSWTVHNSMASGNPAGGATYHDHDFWLPHLPAHFNDVVSFMAGRLLFEPVSTKVIDAACAAVGVSRREMITPTHLVAVSRVQLVLSCLLDSSLHMNR